MTLYWFADECVDSNVELPLVTANGATDVFVAVRSIAEAPTLHFTRLLHRGDLDGAPWALGELGDQSWGVVLGTGCIATISADLERIDVAALPSAPSDWLAEAIVGWMLVYRLALLGRPAFHSSAATLDGVNAVAFCGATHSGKSTMAAAAVALGGALLTDDVLVPRIANDVVEVSTTANAVKLRGRAQDLGDADAPTTFDGRRRLGATTSESSLRLSHIIFFDPTSSDPEPRLLEPGDVAVRLLAESKVGTWQWDEARDREFEMACEVASRVGGYLVGREDGEASRDQLIAACARLFAP